VSLTVGVNQEKGMKTVLFDLTGNAFDSSTQSETLSRLPLRRINRHVAAHRPLLLRNCLIEIRGLQVLENRKEDASWEND